MPHGENRLTSMCIDSGLWDMKSKIRAGSCRNMTGVGLERVDHVGELDGVADEEHAQVVADEVPVAVLGVELHGEPARVARGLRGVPAADHRGETQRHRRLLALLREQLRAGV